MARELRSFPSFLMACSAVSDAEVLIAELSCFITLGHIET